MPVFDYKNHQGGKAYGEYLKKWENQLDEINQSYLDDPDYNDEDDVKERLQSYKNQFIECDRDLSGDLDIQDVKYMMEKLGQAKTHLEIKKMIAEVDNSGKGTINYGDFVLMMLGPKSSVLKLILMFEEKMKPKEKPKGLPPQRSLDSLP